MRRTYRSKRDSESCLDRKDVLLATDEKKSVFNAFYIKKIKQAKRELSCVGSSSQYNPAPSKIRRNRYVKRLVKDVVPVAEESITRPSFTKSTFLTPNKSIHVNKEPDLFDQLLNSSLKQAESPKSNKDNLFVRVLPDKVKNTYCTRKQSQIRKYNYSSSDSTESEKENTKLQTNNTTQNVSDIKTHQLFIEAETKPKHIDCDDSIYKVVNNFSYFNKIVPRRSNTHSLVKTFKRNENRLTKNLQSPLLQNSPISSTPFIEKYRSKSIYKFSPIPMVHLDESRREAIVEENKNDSIASIRNKDVSLVANLIQDETSPLTHLTRCEKRCLVKTKALINAINISPHSDSKEDDEIPNKECFEYKTTPNIENKSNSIEDVPFMGFCNNSLVENNENHVSFNEQEEKASLIYIGTDATIPSQPFLGFTKVEKVINESSESNINHNSFNSVQSNYNESSEQNTSKSESIDRATLYDTCNSEQSSKEERVEKIPVVKIVKMDDSLFQKYYKKMTDVSTNNNSDKSNNASINSDNNSFSSKNSLQFYSDQSSNKESDGEDSIKSATNSSDPQEDNSESYSNSNDEEKCVNFVTTRRGNEITNNTIISVIDDSLLLSSEWEKTILNKTDATLHVNKNNQDVNEEIVSSDAVESEGTCSVSSGNSNRESLKNNSESSEIEANKLNNTKRKSTRLRIKSMNRNSEVATLHINKNNQDVKEEIVSSDAVESEGTCSVSSRNSNRESLKNNSESSEIEASKLNNTKRKSSRLRIKSMNRNSEVATLHINKNNQDVKEEIVSSDAVESEGTCSVSSRNSNRESLKNNSESSEIETSKLNNTKRKSSRLRIKSMNRNSEVATLHINKNNQDFKEEIVSSDTVESEGTCSVSSRNSNRKTLKNSSESSDIEASTSYNTKRKSYRLRNKSMNRNSEVTDKRLSNITRNSSRIMERISKVTTDNADIKPGIVLQPGKKWERSLSIYRRMTMMADHFDNSILEDEPLINKGRKYRQSVIHTMEMQECRGSLQHNDSFNCRRSTFFAKPSRSTIKIVKESNSSRISLCNTTIDDLKGFVNEDCDDTIVGLSKLSIADSEHEVTVLEKVHDTSTRAIGPRDYVLRRCNQTDAILFDECYPDTALKHCRKIGEGVYGEVFLWRAGDGRARVMKIVPIAGTVKVNGEHQKDYHEIISEIVIAMELSALRAPIADIERHIDEGQDIDALDLHSIENATDVFNEVLAVRCVFGSYPLRLLDLWDLYDEVKGSENDNPAILPSDQQYIVLELANAGQDLESYEFNNAEQAYALFLQVAFGLAVGEEAYQFEHRDLHWGNVLIAASEQPFATFVLRGRAHRVARRGVAATIIDYSLSRLSLPLAAGAAGAAGDHAALYNDLAADEGLFGAVGDYQFEVYRLMRDKLANDWKTFEPYTNVLWLHYTLDKMITALRYKRTNTKIHKHYICKLKGIKNRILEYGSAAQFVLTDNEF